MATSEPSSKRLQESVTSQTKDFVWTMPASSEDNMANSSINSDEKAKITSKTFPAELKFEVEVDLEGSKYAFNAVKEGMESVSISKSFAEMKQMDPLNLVNPLNLEDTLVTAITS